MGFGHFKIIAKNFVVSHFQGWNAGLFPLATLQFHNNGFAFLANGAQFVQLRMITGFNDVALSKGLRRIFHNGPLDEIRHIGYIFHVQKSPQAGVIRFPKGFANGFNVAEGLFEGNQVPGGGAAGANARQQALHIGNVFQRFPNRFPQRVVLKKRTHPFQALVNGLLAD